MDAYAVLSRISQVTYDKRNGNKPIVRAYHGHSQDGDTSEMSDSCLRVVEKALCANEHGILVLNSQWLFHTKSTSKDEWHRIGANMNEMAIQPWNLPLLDPVVPVHAKVIVFPLVASYHWSALVWYRQHEGANTSVVLHHYDSMPGMHHDWVTIVVNDWLGEHRQLFYSASRPESEATVNVITAKHFPHQEDARTCGYRVAALVDLLVERARRGVFSPIEDNDPQLTDEREFNARRWRLWNTIHKRLMLLLPDFPLVASVDPQHTKSILEHDENVRQVYQTVLELDADDVDNVRAGDATDVDPDSEANVSGATLLPVLATQRDVSTVLDKQQVHGLIWRDEFISHLAPPRNTQAHIDTVVIPTPHALELRHHELVLFAISPRTTHCAPTTFGYPWLGEPQTLWRYCALAVELVHRVRLWAHELWLDLPTQRALNEQQAHNLALLEDASRQRFGYHFSNAAQAPWGVYNKRRFVDGIRTVFRQCARYRELARRDPHQRPSFADFSAHVLCTLVCAECVVAAPVRVRCSSSTFGPQHGGAAADQPDPRTFSDSVLGLAMLWRGFVGERFASDTPLRTTISHSAAPRSHCTHATLWHAFRVDNNSSPYNTPCYASGGSCFWRFVCNDAPEPTLNWPEFVAAGLRAFYAPVIGSDE